MGLESVDGDYEHNNKYINLINAWLAEGYSIEKIEVYFTNNLQKHKDKGTVFDEEEAVLTNRALDYIEKIKKRRTGAS